MLDRAGHAPLTPEQRYAASRGAISLSGVTRIFVGGAPYKLFDQIWASVLL
jgi:hypothetical protein